MHDLDRIRAASRNVLDLRGLLMVPVGAHLVALALLRVLGRDGWPAGRSGAPIDAWLWLGLVAATVLAWAGLLAWYRRRYGYASKRLSGYRRAAPLLLVLWAGLQWVDRREPPLYTSYLFLALVFATPLLKRYGGRWHYLFLVGGCGFLALLPQLQLSNRDAMSLDNLILGAGFVVCGILDHRMLMRLLPASTGDETDGVAHVQSV